MGFVAEDPLVSTEWLEAHLTDPGIRLVDCRGYVTTHEVAPGVDEARYRGAREEYLAGHIPGAVYLDWTRDIIDPDDPVPVQVAKPEAFARTMEASGIGDLTHVVAVDHAGGQFATRLWWVLMYYGHDAVSVLEGGWNRWVDEGRPTVPGAVRAPRLGESERFAPRPRTEWRHTAEEVLKRLGTGDCQIVDARDSAQYRGDRRRGPRGGHIPGALNVPRELFFSERGGFLSRDEIRSRLIERGVQEDRPVVAYCNGGVAATVVLFHLHRLGFTGLSNYDGSWNEWGPRLDLPVETGAGAGGDSCPA